VTAPPVARALSSLTTLRVGGPPGRLVTASTSEELVDALSSADAAGEPVLLIAGGSNLLIADTGFDGTVIRVATQGVREESVDYCGGAEVTVEAGEPWDPFVDHAIAQGWSGLETLSGIPGSAGATPIQNVGAYGGEVSSQIARVRTWDRAMGAFRTLTASECGFGYRDSRFKGERFKGGPRFVVLQVRFQLPLADLSAPIRYAELARCLRVELGARVPLRDVRDAVLALRRSKGMVLDADDVDTWSAGSFFTNPVLSPEAAAGLPADAPRYPAGDAIKISAAWLIEHAGFRKGYGLPGPASLSTKHTLAITNRGTASAADVLALARQVRDGVRETFGLELVPEPELINCSL
jgi:UDP-N-acetylmuramate dehydrogenase